MASRPGCLTVLGRALAGVAAGLFVILLPITLLTRNLALVIFDPPALSALVFERLVDLGTLRQVVVDQLFGPESSLEGIDLDGAAQYLSPQEREALVDGFIPETWLQDQILRVTTDFLGWFDSPATTLRLTIDTEPVRAQLRGAAAAGLVEALIESWPACTLDSVTHMLGVGAIPGQEGFPFCEPPEPLRGLAAGTLTGGLRLLAEALPAELPVVEQDFSAAEDLMLVKEQVRMVRFASRWGILLSLSFLGWIMALVVRSWRGLARWWGIPLLLGGILSFGLVLVGGPLLRVLLARFTAGANAIPALSDLVGAIGGAMGAAVLRPQAAQAMLIIIVGGGLTLAGFVGRRSAKAAAVAGPDIPAETPLLSPPAVDDDVPTGGSRPSGMFG